MMDCKRNASPAECERQGLAWLFRETKESFACGKALQRILSDRVAKIEDG